MNQFFMSFIISFSMIFLNYAKADSSHVKNPFELCALEEGFDMLTSFDVQSEVEIKQAQELSPELLKLVNIHLQKENYTTQNLTFEQLKALFAPTGPEGSNDLYITVFNSKKFDNSYVQVKSYPGENAYGLIFNAKNQKIVAKIEDGSLLILTPTGTKFCGN